MKVKMGAFVAVLLIPSILLMSGGVQAASNSISAGFAPGPVWLSQSSPTGGTTVRLYTVVYNSSQTPLEGSVTFTIDNASAGTTPFSLDAGESAIESITWTAMEGTHMVSATITSAIDKKTKTTTAIDQSATPAVSVTVTAPLPPPVALEALGTAQTVVASSSPIIASVVAATTATTESLRTAGESYLSQLAGEHKVASTTKSKGSVFGASIEAPSEASPAPDTLSQKIAKIILPVFRYPAIFYPVFLFLVLFIGWVIARRLRNPKKR